MTFHDEREDVQGLDLDAVRDALDRLPDVERVRAAMQGAAFFLEYAAYEMALAESADDVSEIILMAAKLDLASKRLDDASLLRARARSMRVM